MMLYTYQNSRYYRRAYAEKSNQAPNMTSGKFVSLVKKQTEKKPLNKRDYIGVTQNHY